MFPGVGGAEGGGTIISGCQKALSGTRSCDSQATGLRGGGLQQQQQQLPETRQAPSHLKAFAPQCLTGNVCPGTLKELYSNHSAETSGSRPSLPTSIPLHPSRPFLFFSPFSFSPFHLPIVDWSSVAQASLALQQKMPSDF